MTGLECLERLEVLAREFLLARAAERHYREDESERGKWGFQKAARKRSAILAEVKALLNPSTAPSEVSDE